MKRPRVLPLDEAMAALTDAEKLLERWTSDAADRVRASEVLAAELAEAQARAGDDLLDDEDEAAVSRLAESLSRKQTEQGLAVEAGHRAAERLAGVRRDVLKARGAVVRSRAEALRETATARQARADQLLAELAEFEGVAFGPAARPDALGLAGVGFTPMTLTQRVKRRAEWLVNEAEHLEHLAAHGADAEVASRVAAGVVDLNEAERAVAPAEVRG